MAGIEVRGFGKLYFLFKERGWSNPLTVNIGEPLTAAALLDQLAVPAAAVEAVFINRVIRPLTTPLHPGDRVAFIPPGIPTIHRFNLGFYNAREK
ncbi:MAG: MoaD/ThiS family protein [Bacillota bacterium]